MPFENISYIESLRAMSRQLKEVSEKLMGEADEAESKELEKLLHLDSFPSEFSWKVNDTQSWGEGNWILEATPLTDTGRKILRFYLNVAVDQRRALMLNLREQYKLLVCIGTGAKSFVLSIASKDVVAFLQRQGVTFSRRV